MAIGREAAALAGRLNRDVVAGAIRKQGHAVSNQRLSEVLQALRSDKPPPHRR
ncbi:hypothetical protein ACFVH7_42660 [Kitasatospora indigofera]|uniref:hypothetical protein n=1 Tax=Kitasatospora indigofera TaxID=67307 RepID=UPI00363C8DF1